MRASIRQNYTKEEVLLKIQRLFQDQTTDKSEAHLTKIIGLMTFYDVYLPKIITDTVTHQKKGWELIIKSICEMTGYSFDDFHIHKDLKKKLKEEFPEDCKGCDDRKKVWVEKFNKIREEISGAKKEIAQSKEFA